MNTRKLRKRILAEAICGNLTADWRANNPVTQTGADLLAEIRKTANGKKPLAPITDDEKPFEIPDTWTWCRLECLVANSNNSFADGPFGSNLKKEHYTDKQEVRIIQLSNIGEDGWRNNNIKYTTFEHLKTIERSKVNAGDIVIAKMMPAGRAIIVPSLEKSYVLSSDAVKFVPNEKVNKLLVVNFLNTGFYREQVAEDAQGIGRVRTSVVKLRNTMFPLPPLFEQEEIVKRIEQAFAEIDKIEAAQTEIERLCRKINKQLLQQAICGNLTVDWRANNPVTQTGADLLAEIKSKASNKKPLAPITDDEKPFEIPDTWTWCRLGEVVKNRDSERVPLSVEVREKQKNKMFDYYGAAGVIDKVEGYLFNKRLLLIGEDGANLLSKAKPNAFFANGKYWVNNHAHVLDNYIENDILLDFVALRINSMSLDLYVTGSAQPKLNQDNLNIIPIPLPPLSEQEEIVRRIEGVLGELEKVK